MKKQLELIQHLSDRHVRDGQYSVWIGDECVAFPLWNLSGQMVGYQQYRPGASKERKNDPKEGRYYTFLSGERKKKALGVFGLETYHRAGPLFLVEGLFDAVRLHNLGYAAIATLSNDPKHLKQWLWTLQRKLVAICDNDEAGKKLAKLAHESVIVSGSKDLGDMSEAELLQFDMEHLHGKF